MYSWFNFLDILSGEREGRRGDRWRERTAKFLITHRQWHSSIYLLYLRSRCIDEGGQAGRMHTAPKAG